MAPSSRVHSFLLGTSLGGWSMAYIVHQIKCSILRCGRKTMTVRPSLLGKNPLLNLANGHQGDVVLADDAAHEDRLLTVHEGEEVVCQGR